MAGGIDKIRLWVKWICIYINTLCGPLNIPLNINCNIAGEFLTCYWILLTLIFQAVAMYGGENHNSGNQLKPNIMVI